MKSACAGDRGTAELGSLGDGVALLHHKGGSTGNADGAAGVQAAGGTAITELKDLSANHPALVNELTDAWEAWAQRLDVTPFPTNYGVDYLPSN